MAEVKTSDGKDDQLTSVQSRHSSELTAQDDHGSETTVQETVQQPRVPEWIPTMLRRGSGILLTITCCVLLVVLEVVDVLVKKNQGVAADNTNVVRLVRYLPTLAIIGLGYAWKALVFDIKKVLPWSNMSSRWSHASDSATLDYVNGLEIISAFSAVRKRHYIVVLGLGIGFLCGGLVAVSNSLTYIDLFATTSKQVPFMRTTAFSYVDALGLSNGSLSIPFNYTGGKPYAEVIAKRLSNGMPPPWSSGAYIFDAFAPLPEAKIEANSSISASVQAVSASLNCQLLNYTSQPDPGNATVYLLTANEADITAAGCSLPVQQSVVLSNQTLAYLNLTQCSDNAGDLSILHTILSPGPDYTMAGVMCTPRFTAQSALVNANLSTGGITGYSLQSQPGVIDIQTTIENLWVYLNNPIDVATQGAFNYNYNNRPGVCNTRNPVGTMRDIQGALEYFVVTSGLNQDPFSNFLINGRPDAASMYLERPSTYQEDVEELASDIWLQVLSAYARDNVTQSLDGSVTTNKARMRIRQPSLRFLQASLFVIAVNSFYLTTFLRPRTSLKENPEPIAASAIVLSNSGAEDERKMGRLATLSKKATCRILENTEFMLESDPSNPQVSRLKTRLNSNIPRKDSLTQSLSGQQSISNRTSEETKMEDVDFGLLRLKGRVSKTGWRPFSLRIAAKVIIPIAMSVVMIILGILQALSNRSMGLSEDTSALSTAWSLGITLLILLVGYACSGVDAAVRSLAPIRNLRHGSQKHPLLFQTKVIPFFRLPFLARGGSSFATFMISSVLLLIFPAIKLVTAGLYTTVLAAGAKPVSINVDTSVVDGLENIFNLSLADFTQVVQRASDFAEWSLIPEFNVPQQAGIVQSGSTTYVLSNFTSVANMSKDYNPEMSIIHARVSAIAIDITCGTVDTDWFDTSFMNTGQGEERDAHYSFSFNCTTDGCAQTVGVTDEVYASQWSSGGVVNYGGKGRLQASNASTGSVAALVDSPYNALITDYSCLAAYFNQSYEAGAPDPNDIPANHTYINTLPFDCPVPQLHGASCTRNLSVVEVDATYARSTVLDAQGNATLVLPWSPVSVNPQTISYKRDYPWIQPFWFAPRSASFDEAGSNLIDGYLSSETLVPAETATTNFFELLAVTAEYQFGNLSILLDVEQFTDVARVAYASYCAQVLNQLRPYIISASGSTLQAIQGTLQYKESRIRQDIHTTIAIEVLLGVVLFCLIVIFIHFPNKAMLPKPPDSIASRLSLLANSSLVHRLREERVIQVHDTTIWDEPAALGWWRADRTGWAHEAKDDSVHEHREVVKYRWGIDVGQNVELSRWDSPPKETVSRVDSGL